MPFDLEDMQRVQPLTFDINLYHMYFEMRLNSEYELLVTEDEVSTPMCIKPLVIPV